MTVTTARKIRYRNSQKGRATEAAYQHEYVQSGRSADACRRFRLRNKAKDALYDRRRNLAKRGLTLETFDVLLKAQGRRCANPGCRTTDPGADGWHIDHNHETNRTRGLLRRWCNLALGQMKDNSVRLRGLADYAEQYQ